MAKRGKQYWRLALRNQALITRYWYWSEVWQRSHEKTLEALEKEEFFLGRQVIHSIVRKDTVVYKKLCEENPTVKELARRFPGFRFEDNPHYGQKRELSQPKLF